MVMSRALQRWRVSIAPRRHLLGDAVLRVIRIHAGMVLHALEMRDELGRDAIGQIGWNVVELAGPQVADPNEDLEVGNTEWAHDRVPRRGSRGASVK